MKTLIVLAESFEEAVDMAVEEYFEEITQLVAKDGKVKIEYGTPEYYDDGLDYDIEKIDDFIIDKEFLEEHGLMSEYVEVLESLVAKFLAKKKKR